MAAVARKTAAKRATKQTTKQAASPRANGSRRGKPRTGRFLRVTNPVAGVIHTEKMEVNPEQAAEWLQGNTIPEGNKLQRRKRQTVVDLYAHDMKNGHWRYTSESIKFDRDGMLIDGQHRLLAIVQSGCSIEVDVVVGLDPDVRHYLDIGAKRSVGDMLTMDGIQYAHNLGSIARTALLVQLGAGTSTGRHGTKVSPADIQAYVHAHLTKLVEACRFAMVHRQDFLPLTYAPIAYAYMRLTEVDAKAAERFFTKWASGLEWHENDPFISMMRRARRAKDFRERVDTLAWVAMIIRGWNAWRRGESMGKSPLYVGGKGAKVPDPV